MTRVGDARPRPRELQADAHGTALQIAFLDSWSRDASIGSGSTAAISGLIGALEAGGHTVVRPAPCTLPFRGERVPTSLSRLAFNAVLPLRLRASRFDLVVGIDCDGTWLPRDSSVPYVVCLKGVAADEARFERRIARRRLLALAAIERRNAGRADRVIVPSRYSREVAAERYRIHRSKIRVVPEGIEFAYWSQPDAPPTAGPPTILSVARQYPRKNTRALLRAFPTVLRTVPDARLRIVGGGPELAGLRGLVARLGLAGRVNMLGSLKERERVRDEYRRADLFCLPSLQEGFGIAFLEAMAAGLPVVALRTSAVPEVVPDGVAGVLVEPDRPAELATALARLLGDPRRRARMGRAGREHASRYDWRSVADRFLEAALGPLEGR